ncbi:hypothetical protein DL766_004649 [Monosporascus sp. MC13-8B]|nr:hypothetical protein DL763_008463 [Monosporascus cannonballus]RYP30930.1 hypothetical protein DL766_004649 [Monosporascus sp. MC13-8B]
MPIPSHFEECQDLQSAFEILVRDDLIVKVYRRPRYRYFIYVNDAVLERFEQATAGKPKPDYYCDDVVVVVVSAEQYIWNPNYPDSDSDEEDDEDGLDKEMGWLVFAVRPVMDRPSNIMTTVEDVWASGR